MGYTSRPGRVADTKIFPPTARKRRLVSKSKEDVGVDAKLTAEAGAWLKQLREAKGLSQSDLCKATGMKYRYSVSMIESGKNRLLPVYFEAWAESFGVPAREFVKTLLSYYAPLVYDILLKDE